jgi:hypothetical protein
VLTAQKAALIDAAHRGLIATDTADAEIASIDRRLVRLAATPSWELDHVPTADEVATTTAEAKERAEEAT